MSERRIRILIVDDHAIVRQGLRAFLETQEDLEVVAEANDGETGVEMAARYTPDVVLMDLVMPKIGGAEATRALLRVLPEARVIVLTSFSDDDQVVAAIRGGAVGYLLKDIKPHDLAEAVRSAWRGEPVLHPGATRALMRQVHGEDRRKGKDPGDLTAREHEVLLLVAKGWSNRRIGVTLSISEKTVKTHVSHILGKLALADRTQMAVFAHEKGLAKAD